MDRFLNHVRGLAEYWDGIEERTSREKLDGMAFSMLNIFDGTTMDFPAMDIVLSPHEDDKQYHIDNDEDWFEPGMVINDDGMLHEMYYEK